MNERIREQVRSFVHPDLLDEFEGLAIEVDDIWERLNAETDKTKAWKLAVRWATAILTLTRMESALLSSVLPIIEESFVETSDEMAQIRHQQDEADRMVYELRRGQVPRPLDPEGDARYYAEVEETKATRNEIQLRLGKRLRELARINESARVARSQVGLSLRVLRQFISNRFPQPISPSPYRRMSSVRAEAPGPPHSPGIPAPHSRSTDWQSRCIPGRIQRDVRRLNGDQSD